MFEILAKKDCLPASFNGLCKLNFGHLAPGLIELISNVFCWKLVYNDQEGELIK